jgi:glutathione S-transferase
MKLYYMQGSCSLAAHIAAREVGLDFQLVRFDKKDHLLEGGAHLEDVNEKGYVPVLELDDGRRLTEVQAVLQYIADLKPAARLAPPAGTFERSQLQEWLSFLSSELHKSFWPFFHDGCEDEKPNQAARLKKGFSWVEKKLGDRPFLQGDTFTIADAYLTTMTNWIKPAGFDLGAWPGLKAYRTRMLERPTVRAALEAEGLVKRPA